MIPMLKRSVAAGPTSGVRACAASAADPMLVLPAAWSVSRRDDDEERHELREEHAHPDVPGAVAQLRVGGSLALPQPVASLGHLVLHLSPGLPEEEVRVDRRAQDG